MSMGERSKSKASAGRSSKPASSGLFRHNEYKKEAYKVPPIVNEVLNSPGRPLDPDIRAFMEPRFGHDFGRVRVHTGSRAADSARAVNAKAYTVGRHIVFGAGHYAPKTITGQRILAHEVAHVVQQGTGNRTMSENRDYAEREAWSAADQLLRGADYISISHGMAVPAFQAADDVTSPLTIPKEGIEMPWVGSARPHSEKGYLRDANYFWKQYLKKWPEQLSDHNKALINGRSLPKVDETWIKFHREHAAYKGDPIEHHHLGQGSRAVPIPRKLHDAYTVFHPERQVVGDGAKPVKPLKPQPTKVRTEREIRRHIKEGRIRGNNLQPKAPKIPLSSELSGLPPEQLKPVSPKELDEVRRVDPTSGRVAGGGDLKGQAKTKATRATKGNLVASVGTPDMRPVQASGPSPRGVGIGAGITLAFQSINFVLNWINDRVQEQRVRRAFDKIKPYLARARTDQPNMGSMLFFYYTRVEAPPDSLMQPGAVFSHIEFSRGRTQDEAVENWQRSPSIRQGHSPGTLTHIQRVWIPPLQAASVAELRSPFERLAIGTFKEGGAKLQNVEWGGITGFDDESEFLLHMRPGAITRFYILKPPYKIVWFNGNMRMTTQIPVEERAAAEGGNIPVVNLDPVIPFSDVTAACIFPADDGTAALFSSAPPTYDNLGQLRYTNFKKVRWVRPENIKIIGRI